MKVEKEKRLRLFGWACIFFFVIAPLFWFFGNQTVRDIIYGVVLVVMFVVTGVDLYMLRRKK